MPLRCLRALVAVGALGMVMAPPVAAAGACAARGNDVEALHLQVTADRASYRPGQLVAVTAVVSAPDGDAAKGVPVAGAVVQVVVLLGGRERAAVGGTTDAAGRVVRSFRLAPDVPAGALRAEATARAQVIGGTDCGALLSLTGRRVVDPLARVAR